MGICILGGHEGFLRKTLSDKLTTLGQTIGIGATAAQFSNAIQSIYDDRYTAGQDSLKVSRKLTLTSSQTGTNINIADNWYTTCDASAVYAAGQASVKVARKLTLTSSQIGSNVDIADNWYTTCDASAVYTAGKQAAKLLFAYRTRVDGSTTDHMDSDSVTATVAQTVTIKYNIRNWNTPCYAKVSYFIGSTEHVISAPTTAGEVSSSTTVSLSANQVIKLRAYGKDTTNGAICHSCVAAIVY